MEERGFSRPRTILHLDISSFAATLAQVTGQGLRGRPTIIRSGGKENGHSKKIVLSASREAKQEGIYRGMLLSEALWICRNLRILPPNFSLCQKATNHILQIFSHYSPLVEPVRLGHVFADVSGTERLLGSPKNIGYRLQKEVAEKICLPSCVGLASNKLVSHLAAHYVSKEEPKGLLEVRQGNEASFLAPLPVVLLPEVNSLEIRRLLSDLNLQFVRELTSISLQRLKDVFGKRSGFFLFEQARGIDRSPVCPPQKPVSFFQEKILEDPTNHHEIILNHLFVLIERIKERFLDIQKKPNRVELEVVYEDHYSVTGKIVLTREKSFQDLLFNLFQRIVKRRIQIRILRLRWFFPEEQGQQLELFHVKKEDPLDQALRKIRNRFGFSSIQWGNAPMEEERGGKF